MASRARWSRILLAAAGVVAVAVILAFRSREHDVRYATTAADRGDIMEVVGATGTVQAVQTVQVGSQVSGTIQALNADFNSVVKKGAVIARLDPSLFQARVGQAQASVVSSRANVERTKADVDDAQQKLARAKALAAEKLLPQSDLDTAQATYDSAAAQLKAAQAAVSQAQANLNQAQVDLQHTVIDTPIDGVVIARNVDVGQTVAASFQAPVLFVIANDLKHMQVNASIDEADIGRVKESQEVRFRVDAYPDRTFVGRVDQVRLQPTTVQNVVTYNTLISVDNQDGRLMPGMTATVSVIVRKSEGALRVPAAALRFRPEGFTPGGGRGGRPGGAPGAGGGPGTGGGQGPALSAGPQPGGAAGDGQGPGGGRGPGAGPRGAGGGGGWPRGGGQEGGGNWGEGGARPSLVFVTNDKGQPEPVRVHTGVSDGQFVEVKDGLSEGARVIVGLEGEAGRGAAPRPSGSPSNNPFNPQFQRRQR